MSLEPWEVVGLRPLTDLRLPGLMAMAEPSLSPVTPREGPASHCRVVFQLQTAGAHRKAFKSEEGCFIRTQRQPQEVRGQPRRVWMLTLEAWDSVLSPIPPPRNLQGFSQTALLYSPARGSALA